MCIRDRPEEDKKDEKEKDGEPDKKADKGDQTPAEKKGDEAADAKMDVEESKAAEKGKSADKAKEQSAANTQASAEGEPETKKRPEPVIGDHYTRIGELCTHEKLPEDIYRCEDFENIAKIDARKEIATATTEDQTPAKKASPDKPETPKSK